MIQPTDLARVRIDLKNYVHLAAVVRDQNLLPDKAG